MTFPTIRPSKPTNRDERRAKIVERIERSMAERCPIVNVKGDSPFSRLPDDVLDAEPMLEGVTR